MSKYIWQLNENQIAFDLMWDIAASTTLCKCGTGRYNHWLTEKSVLLGKTP